MDGWRLPVCNKGRLEAAWLEHWINRGCLDIYEMGWLEAVWLYHGIIGGCLAGTHSLRLSGWNMGWLEAAWLEQGMVGGCLAETWDGWRLPG